MLLKSSIFDGAVLLLSKLGWFNHCLITLNHDVWIFENLTFEMRKLEFAAGPCGSTWERKNTSTSTNHHRQYPQPLVCPLKIDMWIASHVAHGLGHPQFTHFVEQSTSTTKNHLKSI